MAYGMTEAVGITALRGDEWMEHEGSVGGGCAALRSGSSTTKASSSRPARSVRSSCARRRMAGRVRRRCPELRETPDGFRPSATWLRRRRRLPLPRRPTRRHDRQRRRQRLPRRGRARAHRPPQIADVVVVGLRTRSGAAGSTRSSSRLIRQTPPTSKRSWLREVPARAVQGAEVRGDHRLDAAK